MPSRRAPRITALFVLAIAALGYALQSRTYLNHDVAYIMWGVRAMLRGAVFGRDIIDPNPPLAWYLSMGPVWLAEKLNWPIDVVFRLGLLLLGSLSIASAHWRLGEFARSHRVEAVVALSPSIFSGVAAISFFLLCAGDFGQREHIMAMLVLPYVVSAATRAAARESPAARHLGEDALSLAIGIAAGIGFAIKPHFYLAPLLIEGLILLKERRLAAVLRIETLAIPVIAILYIAVIFLFHRAYLEIALPRAMQIYWTFNMPLLELLRPILLPGAILALVFWLIRRLSVPRVPLTLVLAALGFLLAYLAQLKGYTYQAYPVVTFTALALATVLPLAYHRRVAAALTATTLCLTLSLSAYVTTLWWWDYNKDFGESGHVLTQLIEAINAQAKLHAGDAVAPDVTAPSGGLQAISTHPIPSFPMAIYTDASLVSRSGGQLFLHATVALREGRLPPNPALQAFAESNARRIVLEELQARPWIVFVDSGTRRFGLIGSDYDFLTFYNEDPAFRALWKSYREAEMIGRFRVFLRDDTAAN